MTRDVKPELFELGQRVKALRVMLRFNQNDFAKKLNLANSTISEIESGKTKPGYDFFYSLSTHFPVNFDYLLHGKGEMLLEDEEMGTLSIKGIGERFTELKKILWYIEKSPMFMHSIIGYAIKFLYENDNVIKKDIEEYKSEKNRK